MDYRLEKVTEDKKTILYRLLQFALYDGSQYYESLLNEDAQFDYGWFDNYFTDDDREAYFILVDNKYSGFVMINENFKVIEEGKTIAEFLVMPNYRKMHLGKKVAYEIFDKYETTWEVQPMDNNPIAYKFWNNIINEYDNNSRVEHIEGMEDVFILKSRSIQ